MSYLKSRAVADSLGVSYYRLFELLRSKRLAPPRKDSSGDYVWTQDDVQRARLALKGRHRKASSPIPDGQETRHAV
jgi:hypothetical protein